MAGLKGLGHEDRRCTTRKLEHELPFRGYTCGVCRLSGLTEPHSGASTFPQCGSRELRLCWFCLSLYSW